MQDGDLNPCSASLQETWGGLHDTIECTTNRKMSEKQKQLLPIMILARAYINCLLGPILDPLAVLPVFQKPRASGDGVEGLRGGHKLREPVLSTLCALSSSCASPYSSPFPVPVLLTFCLSARTPRLLPRAIPQALSFPTAHCLLSPRPHQTVPSSPRLGSGPLSFIHTCAPLCRSLCSGRETMYSNSSHQVCSTAKASNK